MNMQQTSLSAYWNDVKPKLGEKQSKVFDAIEKTAPVNDRQLAEHLGWPINCVTNRRGELVKKLKVVEDRREIDPATGRQAIYWKPRLQQQEAEDTL